MSHAAVAGNLTGDVHGVTPDNEIVGWALDTAHPDRPVALDIVLDGAVHRVAADLPRPDLRDRFGDHINHGFRFALPAHLVQGCDIDVQFADGAGPVPRGQLAHAPAPRHTAPLPNIKGHVYRQTPLSRLTGWVCDTDQPATLQSVTITLGADQWQVPADRPPLEGETNNPAPGPCGFSWDVPLQRAAGAQPVQVIHSQSGNLLSGGDGVLNIPLNSANAKYEVSDLDLTGAGAHQPDPWRAQGTRSAPAGLGWPEWSGGQATLAIDMLTESFYEVSVIVRQSVLAGLEVVSALSLQEEDTVINFRRGRSSIPLDVQPLDADMCRVSFRICVRRPDSFAAGGFTPHTQATRVFVTLTHDGADVQRDWLSDYLCRVQVTAPMLGFDAGEAAGQSPQLAATVRLPRDTLTEPDLVDRSVMQAVRLFLPKPLPVFQNFVENVLGTADIQMVSTLVSILIHARVFRRNTKAPLEIGETTYGVDGWYDLATQTVADRLAQLEAQGRSVISFDSQYEVSRMRVTADETRGPGFVGCMSAGYDFSRLTADYKNIVVNFDDPAGGDASALLKLVNICLNSARPFVVAPADLSQSRLPAFLGWATGLEDTGWLVAHLAAMDPRAAYYRAYVAHCVRCKMAPMVTAAAAAQGAQGGDLRVLPSLPAVPAPDLSVTVVTSSKRPWMIQNILANFDRQNYPHKDHIIVLHGDFDADTVAQLQETIAAHPDTQLLCQPKQVTLGGCLNAAVGLSRADYIAKFDDDDHYGPHFLEDAAQQIWLTDADIYTQPLNQVYLEHFQKLVYQPEALRKAMRFVTRAAYSGFFGSGGTLILKRHVGQTIGFSDDRRGGLDTDFFFRAVHAGHTAYVGAAFNYTFVRRADKGSHTWSIEDDHFLKAGVVLSEGHDLEGALAQLHRAQDPDTAAS